MGNSAGGLLLKNFNSLHNIVCYNKQQWTTLAPLHASYLFLAYKALLHHVTF